MNESGSRREPRSGERLVESDEERLVVRAAQGDVQAFHALVDLHAGHLHRTAWALVGNASDAEDAVQETFLAAVEGIGGFERRSGVRTWLVSILVRQAALVRRKRRPTLRLTEESGVTGDPAAGADARLDVGAVLAQMSVEHREVLVLREFEGMSYEEIARAIGVPRGTVESRLHRARQEMKGQLKGYGVEAKRAD